MSERSAPPNSPAPDFSWPKSARILRSSEFRRIYNEGARFQCRHFAAFCLHRPDAGGARFGFTLPRAVGKSNIRNRIRRRLREMLRLGRTRFAPNLDIVVNPRRLSLEAASSDIARDIERLIAWCANLRSGSSADISAGSRRPSARIAPAGSPPPVPPS